MHIESGGISRSDEFGDDPGHTVSAKLAVALVFANEMAGVAERDSGKFGIAWRRDRVGAAEQGIPLRGGVRDRVDLLGAAVQPGQGVDQARDDDVALGCRIDQFGGREVASCRIQNDLGDLGELWERSPVVRVEVLGIVGEEHVHRSQR